jgi:hypothetical protein
MCYLKNDWTGYQCLRNLDFDHDKGVLYPGYRCSNENNNREVCAFADKLCIDQICKGRALYETCESSGDCYYGTYCMSGVCMEEVGEGDKCTSHEACGNAAFCLFTGSTSKENSYGLCTAYASIDDSNN